jgi:OHCU decarboxylase
MNSVLAQWNQADEATALAAMLACCSARRWAEAMVALRPSNSVGEVRRAADQVWSTMEEPDWIEAFAAHPRIGEREARSMQTTAADWSQQEQSSTALAPPQVLTELAQGNALYEQIFGFSYIVCATGKSAEEMLAILRRRLSNDRQQELREAAEQQREIMQIRLGKWLAE